MSQNVNQFSQAPVQGQMDLEVPGNVLSAQVDTAQSGNLVAGQAVKLATTAGGVPKVIALAANTDQPFGFIARNLKDQSVSALNPCEIAFFNSVMYMTAGGAITRGAAVEVSNSAVKVVTSGGTNPVCGYALDTALADGDLIRVMIQAPYSAVVSNLANNARSLVVSATLAEINAGKVLIPAAVGQKITVTGLIARVTGAFASGTAVVVESTNGTPVVVETIAEAALTSGAVVFPSSANVTPGAGFGAALGTGDGLQVVNSGSAQTGGTKIDFTINFTQQ